MKCFHSVENSFHVKYVLSIGTGENGKGWNSFAHIPIIIATAILSTMWQLFVTILDHKLDPHNKALINLTTWASELIPIAVCDLN